MEYILFVVTQTKRKQGDFIITGTDGLFDNVYDEQILTLMENVLEAHAKSSQHPEQQQPHHRPHQHHPPHSPAGHEKTAELCQRIAVALLEKVRFVCLFILMLTHNGHFRMHNDGQARDGAANESWESPFARNARTYGRFYFRGGKWDDITVIVSVVCDNPSSTL